MAKTYGTVTTFTAGSVLTAAQLNVASTAVNNLVVPATVQVRRTTNLTSYTSDASISWSNSAFDTDGMFVSGTDVTINTAGIYLANFVGQLKCTATLTSVYPSIRIGGAAAHYAQFNAALTTEAYFSISVILSLSAGNVITASIIPVGGSAYSVVGNSSVAADQTRLTLTWIGRTS